MTAHPPPVDSLAFVGESLFGPGQLPEELFASLERAAVDKVVLAPHRPEDYGLSAANEAVARTKGADPGRRRQLGRVDPNHREAVPEIRRCADEHHVDGFYLSPREEVFAINGSRAQRALDVIAEVGVPVVVEAGVPWVSEALQVAEVARRYAQTPFVLTNGGQLNISGLGQEEAFMALRDCPNIHVQTAGVYRQDFIETVVASYGADRVLFSSSSPVFEPSYEVLRVLGAALTERARAAVLAANAEVLFWRSPRRQQEPDGPGWS